ncbi:hypothetical protein MyNCGM121_60410 [Achromobacter xylosoxidans]
MLTQRLIRHGRAATTPFALIENGSRPEQRVLSGPLEDLPRLARAHAIRSPALLIVGEVAGLAQSLHWFGEHLEGATSCRAWATPATASSAPPRRPTESCRAAWPGPCGSRRRPLRRQPLRRAFQVLAEPMQ